MRDFGWFDVLYAVVKDNGKYAGVPCRSYGEARDLSAQHEGSRIFELVLDEDEDKDWDDEPADIDSDMGFDPYLGCFSDDC